MDIQLNPIEERIIGCLIEKEMATPEYYPLTLKALVAACNQKSNRQPTMSLDTEAVEKALYELRIEHKLAVEVSSTGNRVPKYRHNIAGHWNFSPAKMAILCELLVRGPQTPGDLRAHASRLHPLVDADEVEEILHGLETRTDGPFVINLEREPGQRERRWAQLFGGQPQPQEEQPDLAFDAPVSAPTREDRILALEIETAALRQEIEQLKTELAALKSVFE